MIGLGIMLAQTFWVEGGQQFSEGKVDGGVKLYRGDVVVKDWKSSDMEFDGLLDGVEEQLEAQLQHWLEQKEKTWGRWNAEIESPS